MTDDLVWVQRKRRVQFVTATGRGREKKERRATRQKTNNNYIVIIRPLSLIAGDFANACGDRIDVGLLYITTTVATGDYVRLPSKAIYIRLPYALTFRVLLFLLLSSSSSSSCDAYIIIIIIINSVFFLHLLLAIIPTSSAQLAGWRVRQTVARTGVFASGRGPCGRAHAQDKFNRVNN